jgi:hypothetical protein
VSGNRQAAGDCRNDAYFIAVFHRRGFFFEKANVFAVDENIDEATNISLFVTHAFFQAGIGFFQIIEQLADVATARLDEFQVIGEFAQRSRNEDGWHGC